MHSILLVDDDSMVSDVLGQILTRLGYHVEIASGGPEGLRMFDSRVYDLVITDMLMPEIDGHSMARHIRSSDRPKTPIIGISGTPWLLQIDIFDSVIAKPFKIQALTNAIDGVMENGSKPRTLTEDQGQNQGIHGASTSPLLAT